MSFGRRSTVPPHMPASHPFVPTSVAIPGCTGRSAAIAQRWISATGPEPPRPLSGSMLHLAARAIRKGARR